MARAGVDDVATVRLREALAGLGVLARGRARTGLSHEDADDTAGTVATDDALGFDPFPLLRALDRCGARAVVIGQVAGIMHGSRELTGDLDLLWDGDPGQAAALAAAFASVRARLVGPDGDPVACGPTALALPKVLFRSASASGDCCTPELPWGSLPVTDFLRRCLVATTADGGQIRYLARDDLITMRRAAGRAKDLRRAAELEQLRAASSARDSPRIRVANPVDPSLSSD